MPVLAPDSPARTLEVRPWPDAVIDALGHDPRSPYVEQFWLAVLGPSATWLLRRLAAGLEQQPSGFELDLEVTARSLGLGMRSGRHSTFLRTVKRCCAFGATRLDEPGNVLMMRRKLPPLTRHQVDRLPDDLRAAHEAWLQAERGVAAGEQRDRARRLALSLFELGQGVEEAERRLVLWRFPPRVAREAAAWALNRHHAAAAAAAAAGDHDPDPPALPPAA